MQDARVTPSCPDHLSEESASSNCPGTTWLMSTRRESMAAPGAATAAAAAIARGAGAGPSRAEQPPSVGPRCPATPIPATRAAATHEDQPTRAPAGRAGYRKQECPDRKSRPLSLAARTGSPARRSPRRAPRPEVPLGVRWAARSRRKSRPASVRPRRKAHPERTAGRGRAGRGESRARAGLV